MRHIAGECLIHAAHAGAHTTEFDAAVMHFDMLQLHVIGVANLDVVIGAGDVEAIGERDIAAPRVEQHVVTAARMGLDIGRAGDAACA